ncbi:hypothetical protein [Microvirga sp. Mcv34]|uniref:hypothetical protein n=1 Tax=Microvirga sp. Mcv34 TaxID=2926016 RepID=UPI0021C93711|nr:hypothetical protein [Microvirga sp. Mcv34]
MITGAMTPMMGGERDPHQDEGQGGRSFLPCKQKSRQDKAEKDQDCRDGIGCGDPPANAVGIPLGSNATNEKTRANQEFKTDEGEE